MAEYRWYDLLNEITKVERKYNIRNPNWDNGFPGVFHDYGFVPVDAKGDWWTRIPDAPEIPIIYAPVATTSYTIPSGIGTTTTTGLIDTVNVIGDATFTELATGESVATVTTAGAVSATSSAVATGAVGAAIGFGVGVATFETIPEFWTRVSNTVFGTDLDPEEIGQMARDTNALIVIKDGVVFMAEDMVNAIRDAFFDNGAADTSVIPSSPSTEDLGSYTLTSYGGSVKSLLDSILSNTQATLTVDTQFYNAPNTSLLTAYKEVLEMTGAAIVVNVKDYYNSSGSNTSNIGVTVQYIDAELPFNGKLSRRAFGSEYQYLFAYGNVARTLAGGFNVQYKIINGEVRYYLVSAYVNRNPATQDTTVLLGSAFTDKPSGSSASRQWYVSSLNAIESGGVSGITPTGDQGNKDQPLSVVFPGWVSKAIETVAGDGVTKVKWLPVSLPATNPLVNGNPFTTDQAQTGQMPGNYTDTANQLGEQTEEATKTAPSYPTPPIPSVPDVTPTPTSPSISGGGGSTTGLANLYNPTLAQVKEFSRWLWGSDGLNLDQLKKLLQDPMQAIIGLHVMYAAPTTGEERGIQVGYINSGVNSKIVTEQYTEIDCGTVTINEYFGDVRDYSPYTQVYCYLPFIGIVELNADDVVNSNLGIKYKIDVLTGCCLAQLTVKKYGLDAVLYTYTGNCAVQMPITSGNYLSTVSSLLSAVVSGASAVATGGALTPVAIGAAANAMGGGARASVAMSGSLGSNAGAMGIRKPYLIIKRVESADANGYNEFYGYPTNKRVNLSQLTGYVRVKEINLSGTNATEDEQNEIVTLLKEGVIL